MTKPHKFALAVLSAGFLAAPADAKGPVFVDLSAGAHDADIVSANPAGMTRVAEASWRAGLLVSYSESTWEVTSSGLDISSESKTDNAVYIPSLAYLRPLGDRWAIGASLSATSGMGDDGSEESVSRYLSTDWSLGSFTFQPSVAYRLTDAWSIGAAVGVNYTAYSWEAAVFNGIGQNDGKVELEPDDINLNYILAAHWSGRKTRFGISYRSEYEPNMSDSPDYSGVDPDREQSEDIELDITLPQSVLAGVYRDFDNGHWLSFDVLWVEASKFNIDSGVVDEEGGFIRNPYNLNDSWVFSAGWGMPLTSQWDVGVGAMYLHDPIDDENRSVLLRIDSLWGLGLSADYNRKNGAVISGAISYLFTGDGDVTSPALPIIGVIDGEYTDRTNLLFELSYSW
jgi:long-chain fatty acid transport protein